MYFGQIIIIMLYVIILDVIVLKKINNREENNENLDQLVAVLLYVDTSNVIIIAISALSSMFQLNSRANVRRDKTRN